MVPNKPISTFASIKHGYAFAGEYFSKEKQDYILLTPGNFHIDQRLYFGANTKYYNGPIDDGYVLSNGDLLVVMTDLTKDMAILGNAVMLYSDVPVLHNQRIGLVETNEGVSKEYLCYLINSEHVRRHVKATASGTTVRHTSPSKMLNVKAHFPPLPEQQKIAKTLSTWDKAISTTERLIENSTQQKKALMQQLLTGKKRLLDESGKRFEGEWETQSIESLTNRVGDGIHSTPKYTDKSSIRFVNGNNLNNGSIVFSDLTKFVDEGDAKNHHRDLSSRTILMSINGTIGNLAIYNDENIVLGKSACYINVKEEVDVLFIFYKLASSEVQSHFISRLTGSTIKNLSLTTIKSTQVALPSIPEQQKIATVLTNADKEIELLEQQLADLQQEKKALMQVLLTGKKRVVVDGEVA